MERWQMNRLGFVNFWVYDIEEFPIYGGRLLLRGANGSGKSITTQSFIPYILDGNRLPSRLDPFGGKERKMDYYLIGNADSEKKESTGYIWLEFAKPESGQYKTIGIGMRAKKGGDFKAWGFCLKDGSRIGDGFELYSNVGSQFIPHDHKTLKKLLGDDNIFIEKVVEGKYAEYKLMVASEIFGITRNSIEDFDRLTKVLIQTRSSKLSSKENLKPEQLYVILNDSLQTLTDEDLRPMTEAMTKIEDMQFKIEAANKARCEVKYIADEYDRYNRYMLWIKSKKYLDIATDVNEKQKDYDSQKSSIESSERKIKETESLLEKEQIRLSDFEREKELLDISSIEKQSQKRKDSRDKLKKSKDEYSAKEERLEGKHKQIRSKYHEQSDSKTEIEGIKYDMDKQLKSLDGYSDSGFPFYKYFSYELKNGNVLDADRYRNECRGFSSELESVIKKFDEQDYEREKYEEAQKELSEAASVRTDKKVEKDQAEEQLNEQKDVVIEAIYKAAKDNKEFMIDEPFRNKLSDILEFIEKRGNSEYSDAMFSHYEYLKKNLNDRLIKAKEECRCKKSVMEDKEKKLNDLLSAKEHEPTKSEFRAYARKALSEHGIRYKALYECIDFKPDVPDAMKTRLEAALTDTGLLDTLVIAHKDIAFVKEIIKEYDESWFAIEETTTSFVSPYFEISEGCEFADEVMSVLSKIHSILSVTADGYYEYGMTAGYANEEQVSFIGAENRRLFRERQIAELRTESELAKAAYDSAESAKNDINDRIGILESEYAVRPSLDNINAALEHLNTACLEFDVADKGYKTAEEKENRVKKAWTKASQEVSEICSKYSQYEKKKQIFVDAQAELRDFEDIVCSIIDQNNKLGDKKIQLAWINESIVQLNNDINEITQDLKRIKDDIHENEEIIRLCTEKLESPENIDIAKRSDELDELIDNSTKKISDHNKELVKEKINITHEKEYLKKTTGELNNLIEQENKLFEIFKEELNLGFVIKADGPIVKQHAEKAKSEVAQGDDKMELSVIQARLLDVFQKHSTDATAEYRLISETMFDNSDIETIRARNKITLLWKGSRVAPSEFTAMIKTAIEDDELLMKRDEQEMFTGILLNILSKKLCVKVDDSKRWVESMSKLMKSIETSQGQAFSLSWNAKKNLGKNELPYDQLNKLLRMNKEMIRSDDIEKLTEHFRSKIEHEKRVVEEKGEEISYSELIRTVLDYRSWFEFKLKFRESGSDNFNELTNSRFSSFSGGERAMSVYIPLFAAVAAQYEKAGEQAPKILALDEAFAGVDDSNISEMFDLLEKLGFGYIINSQSLWGCFKTIPKLNIAELIHEKNSDFITVIKYEWNGKIKKLVK